MNILMVENSEDCELQMKHIKSRSRLYNTAALPRIGKRAQTTNRLMSDLSSVISNPIDHQIKKKVSLENESNELSDGYRKLVEHKYFLICISCFWCASYLKNDNTFSKCPMCKEGIIDRISLEEDEFYRFNHSMTIGIEMEFSNNIQVSSDP
jgi:rubrerythrin